MKRNQLVGVAILILAVVGLGVLTWYTYGLGKRGEVASAVSEPATPADEAKAGAPAPATPSAKTETAAADAKAESSLDPNKDESRVGPDVAGGASAGTKAPAAGDKAAATPAVPDKPAVDTETAMAAPEKPAASSSAIDDLGIEVTGKKPAADAAPTSVPTFDVVRVEPTGDTAVAGLAVPGSKVELMDGDQVVASAEANQRGEWTMILEDPLKPGTHDLALRATSPDGKEQHLSEQRVAVAVPESGSRDVLAVVNEPGAPSRVLDKPGEGASIAAAEPAPMAGRFVNAEPGIAPNVTVDAVEADPDGGLYIAGTAKTQDPVRIYLNGELLGEAKPGPEGKWLHEGTRTLEPGKYTVRADQVGKTGDVIVRAEVPFEREADMTALSPVAEAGGTASAEMSGNMPVPSSVIIRRGDNLWTISRRWYGRGIRYSTIYEANTDQIRDPHWIYPGQVFVMPAGNASWSTE